jgi:hypothetical protein
MTTNPGHRPTLRSLLAVVAVVIHSSLIAQSKQPPASLRAVSAALAHFDLQIPIADGSSVVSIKTLSTDPTKGFDASPAYGAFCWATDRQLIFRVPPNGDTTPNSHFPRTELSQKQKERWKPASGDHLLRGTFAITSVPKITDKGEMTLAQIHDDVSDNGPLCKLMCNYNSRPWKLTADYRIETKKSSKIIQTSKTKRESIELNHAMDYEIKLTSARLLTVKARKSGTKTWSILLDSSAKGQSLDAAWDTETCYFKAGCYMFDPGSSATPAGEVRYSMLGIE